MTSLGMMQSNQESGTSAMPGDFFPDPGELRISSSGYLTMLIARVNSTGIVLWGLLVLPFGATKRTCPRFFR
ncbi:unnamed protein product, partial [Heterotrigona itama]